MAATESYPDELRYHPEHDWARIDGDEADARHHLVCAGRAGRARALRAAGRGATIDEGRSYGEVESVKAVSDLIAPLSGEVLEVNAEGRRRARDGERRSLRRRLARADPLDEPGRGRRAARRGAYKQVLEEQ